MLLQFEKEGLLDIINTFKEALDTQPPTIEALEESSLKAMRDIVGLLFKSNKGWVIA